MLQVAVDRIDRLFSGVVDASFHPAVAATGTLAVLAMSCLLRVAALAQSPKTADQPKSALDAPLFYQLLIGELELRNGQAGNAFEVVLDAARRTKDELLFRRATDIALKGARASRRCRRRAHGAKRCRSRSTRIAT